MSKWTDKFILNFLNVQIIDLFLYVKTKEFFDDDPANQVDIHLRQAFERIKANIFFLEEQLEHVDRFLKEFFNGNF